MLLDFRFSCLLCLLFYFL